MQAVQREVKAASQAQHIALFLCWISEMPQSANMIRNAKRSAVLAKTNKGRLQGVCALKQVQAQQKTNQQSKQSIARTLALSHWLLKTMQG